jgi:hypothetical protein
MIWLIMRGLPLICNSNLIFLDFSGGEMVKSAFNFDSGFDPDYQPSCS